MARNVTTPPAGTSRSSARTGRRPGAVDTRAEILAAAQAGFAELGFSGTTIRGVAARARVDPALVIHYFGTKQRLFETVMQPAIDLDRVASEFPTVPPEQRGERVARFMLELWDAPQMQPLMLGLIRSAATDADAAAMLRRCMIEGPFTAIARALGRPDPDLRASLVASQMLGLVMARYIVRVEPLASAPRETVARAVGPTIQRYLLGDLDRGE
jgi:AcrR family transcriptional regulator